MVKVKTSVRKVTSTARNVNNQLAKAVEELSSTTGALVKKLGKSGAQLTQLTVRTIGHVLVALTNVASILGRVTGIVLPKVGRKLRKCIKDIAFILNRVSDILTEGTTNLLTSTTETMGQLLSQIGHLAAKVQKQLIDRAVGMKGPLRGSRRSKKGGRRTLRRR